MRRTTIVYDDSTPGNADFEGRLRDFILEHEVKSIPRIINSVDRAGEIVAKNPNVVAIVVRDTQVRFLSRTDKVSIMKDVLNALSAMFKVPIVYTGRVVPDHEARRAGADLKCSVGALRLVLQKV